MKVIKGTILLIPLLLLIAPLTHGQAPQRITINNTLSKSLQLEHAANIAYNNGNDLLAISLYKQALQLNPNDLKILTDLGGVEFDAGKYVSAISDFRKTLSINHRSQGALLGLGEIVEVMGGSNITSENYFKQVLTVSAITDFEKVDHVISLTHLKNYTSALSLVNEVLKERPNYTEALIAKGDILLYIGNYTGALKIFNHVLTIHPNLTAAIDEKAISLAGLHDYPQALKLFYKSVSLNQKNAEALYNIGDILDKMGNFTGALKAYIHAQNLAPHNRDVLWNEGLTLGIVALKSHHFADAIKVYNTMLKVEPHNSYLSQARNYAKSKLFESMCCVGGSSLP